MILQRRRIFVVPIRSDLVLEDAVEHWTGRHGDLFGASPGVGEYIQHQPSMVDQRRLGGVVCSEISFTDKAAERRGFTSPYYVREVVPDEASFLDTGRAWMALIRSSKVIDGPPGTREVLAFGWDGTGLPAGVRSEVCELDRPGPAGGPACLVMAEMDQDAAASLATSLVADVCFVARRMTFVS